MFECQDLLFTQVVDVEQLRQPRRAIAFVIDEIVAAEHRSTASSL